MGIKQVLDEISASSLSEQDKGRQFERLIKAWLLKDPTYAAELDQVWLWNEFPARGNFEDADLGIDLVARTKGGEYWAIQCKFHAQGTSTDKAQVDSFISNSGRLFTDPVSHNETAFAARYWISIHDSFSKYAEEMTSHQQIPFQRLSLAHLAASSVDWEALFHDRPERRVKKEPYDYQKLILEKAQAHFARYDRGKLIMACGTGKSYTALLLAERQIVRGAVLVLVPSISLVNQMLNCWMADRTIPIKAMVVCSDPQARKRREDDSLSDQLCDLALPVTTDPRKLAAQYLESEKWLQDREKGLLVIFSTYQSIDAVAEAQKAISRRLGRPHQFDLIICDEAHRTTGIIRPEEGHSDFTKIHDNSFIQGRKRLYMTATPRIYADSLKARARQSDFELCSMDDERLYGREIHNVSFGYAIANGLLTDYKVLVLTVGSEFQLPGEIRKKVRDPANKELNSDLASRLVGCINGLAKNTTDVDNALVWDVDPRIMKRAIAFCPNIDKKGDPASSRNTAEQLPKLALDLAHQAGEKDHKIYLDVRHVDGSMSSAYRAEQLAWLADENSAPDECRVLCNVRCLSEGIDVPALDAAIFLSPRSSQVEVVQAVGRVMRNFRKGNADEKKYGYIIIPLLVNPNVPADEALNDNRSFAVLWSVLNALRSHDERFEAMINSIALNRTKPLDRIITSHGRFYDQEIEGDSAFLSEEEKRYVLELETGLAARQVEMFRELDNKIYARMVEKVGSRLYWERWARDIAPLAQRLIARIGELLALDAGLRAAFQQFVESLRQAINDSVQESQAMEMLGQHLITRPVFEALFAEYAFEENNAVSRAMKEMCGLLLSRGLEKDTAILDRFYESVRQNLGEVKTLSGKQTVIKNLYDSFFKGAFPLAVEMLGIVYTPIECVDFILRSVDAVLKREFGLGLTDRDVHILDPFTGTGTFITRLLQSGLIRPEDLERKYRHEIHCNEIMLLAYYVADVNIESVFYDLTGKRQYQRFDGICLTDTFALEAMPEQPQLSSFLRENFKSMQEEAKAPIRVIIGNPPYSAGQKSGNDNARNLKYPELDKRIEETYVAKSDSTAKNKLYDSYIRAFRWASDRLKQSRQGGVIGFITNGGWLDGNAAAGLRKCLEEEFSAIYVFHLRGDQRTSGELSRKEGGKIFGAGSRAPVVISILVHNPAHQGRVRIFYSDIGDYLSREQKLKIISERRGIFDPRMQWRQIIPDAHGDWLKQRSDLFGQFIPIGDKKVKKNNETFFEPIYALGLNSNRDAWVYNFSKDALEKNIKNTINFYNEQCDKIKEGGGISLDPKNFSWTEPTLAKVKKDQKFSYKAGRINNSIYRPFCKEYLYFSQELNHRPGQWPQLFPTAETENRVICIESPGGKKSFSCLITDKISDLHVMEATQCFPLYYYQKKDNTQGQLFAGGAEWQRRDGITDWILKNIRGRFGNARSITKESIFYYVYGLLHAPAYRARFNDDLKKELARIPIVEKLEDFLDFAETGRELAELHLNYEKAAPCPDVQLKGVEVGNFRVEKMKFAGKPGNWDKSRIIFNSDIELARIPLRAYDYVINGRSAIEWIMESYRIKCDKDSGIKNDPNDWALEHGKPRYILDLLLAVIGLSLKTLELVDRLPGLEFAEDE